MFANTRLAQPPSADARVELFRAPGIYIYLYILARPEKVKIPAIALTTAFFHNHRIALSGAQGARPAADEYPLQ